MIKRLIIPALFMVLLGGVSAQAASYSAVTSGPWHDISTWGGAGIPSIGDTAIVTGGNTVTINVGLTAICSALIIQNTGTLTGPGAFNLRISGMTASIENSGGFSVASVTLPTASGTYHLSGTGIWAPGQFSVSPSAVAQLDGHMSMGRGTFIIATSATLNLMGFTLQFTGIDLTNNGTINVGTGSLFFQGTGTFTHTVGSILGTGLLSFSPSDGDAVISSDGNIAADVSISAGILTGCINGTVTGNVIVHAGATWRCDSGTMTLAKELYVDGMLTRGTGTSGVNINFNGPTLTNNGSISAGFVVFNNSGMPKAQSLAGTGSWPAGTSISIGNGPNNSPSVTTLQNDVTFGFDQVLVQQGSTLDLGLGPGMTGHTLTIAGKSFAALGTLAVGPGTVNFAGTDGFGSNLNGLITGTGTVRLLPSDGLAAIQGRYQTKVQFVSGNMTQSNMSVSGDLTIDAGATLTVNGTVTNTFGNVLINGSLTGNPSGSFVVAGPSFTNNGTITNINLFFDPTACCAPLAPGSTAAAQTFAGAGTWTGPGTFSVGANSALTLGHDLTFGGTTFSLNGSVNTGAFVLTIPGSVTTNGNGELVGGLKRTGFVNGNTVSFGHPNTSIRFDAGTPPAEVTVRLASGPPAGFLTAVNRGYTITPGGGGGYSATLRLHYLDGELNGNNEATMQLWRHTGTTWTPQGASSRDTAANWIELVGVTQFSPWAISSSIPTVTNVSISGQVVNAAGNAVSGATVTLTDTSGQTRLARTNPFGYFSFYEVAAGQSYVVNVGHKAYGFNPQMIAVMEQINNLIITAQP
jgi:hypothetical protein